MADAIDLSQLDPGARSAPSAQAAVVTPDNDNDLTYVTRGLFVGGAGNIAVVMLGGQAVTFTGVVAGSVLPIRVTRVKFTGTTATNINALW
jgi:hypothetical protein